ncbi:MAG: RsmE family RNA methyltransferase [Phycisphaeraceae bacterium]
MDDTSPTPNAQDPADADPRTRVRRLWQPGLAGVGDGQTVELEPEEAQHAAKVLRMREDEAVELFDGRGGVATGVLTQIKARHAVVRIESTQFIPAPQPPVTILAAAPKGARLDSMTAMLVQAGVSRLVLLETRRSVTEPRAGKLQRLHRVVLESCKQCGRAWSMGIEGPTPLASALTPAASPSSVRLLAAPQGPPRHDLPVTLHGATEVGVLIGPEGGFTAEEQRAARDAGYEPWAVGASIMRIETAAIAAAAVLGWALQKPESSPPADGPL